MNFKKYLLEHGINEASEGGFKLNVAKVPLEKARAYAEKEYEKAGKNLADDLPDFDKNYTALQKSLKKAKNYPRLEMPVIEPNDMKKFMDDLKKGHIDIFKPTVEKDLFPKDLFAKRDKAEKFLTLGIKDGDPKDDVIKTQKKMIPAGKLLPTQNEIWLEKLIANTIKFGAPEHGGFITKQTIIVSKEGYILDGHHRFGQIMLADPTIKIDSVYVPLDIDTLVKMGRSFGNALGNDQKA